MTEWVRAKCLEHINNEDLLDEYVELEKDISFMDSQQHGVSSKKDIARRIALYAEVLARMSGK